MPKARQHLISLEATPYYHCISRCVRRAFLCGFDSISGNSYEHRRQWIEERLHLLSSIFCIDLCAYAVMSNHVHTVLHINKNQAESLSDLDICHRWHQLFKGTVLTEKLLKNEPLSPAEYDKTLEVISEWRSRLYNIGWFMRCLNEPIARQANHEDNCTGRFWEGRYRSQALLDESALIACMAYVDLNPIRAKMADSPETSEHTSIKLRIETIETTNTDSPNISPPQPLHLANFVGNPRQNMPEGLPFRLQDYLELVDWTGKIIRDDKRGHIKQTLPPILERLNIETKQWIYLSTKFESSFKNIVGKTQAFKQNIQHFNLKRCAGISNCKALLE